MRVMTKMMLAASILFASSASWASSLELEHFQCGSNVIKVGMTTEQAKSVCDTVLAPAFVSKHERPILRAAVDSSKTHDQFEKWMYKMSGINDTHVLIKNGIVVRIFTYK